MPTDKKISQLASGAPAQGTDETVIARGGANYKLTVSEVVGFLGTPITVANGGTGATTLTGYVKGSGTSAFTASATVPGSDVSGNISGNAANVTGTVAIGNGGSGQTSAQAAMNAFAGAVTSGQYLRGNGTNVVMSAIQAGDVPTLNQNTTGTAAGLSSTLAVSSGGTGQTTYADGELLIGNSTGNTLSKNTLTAGSGISITNGTGTITIAATGTSPIPSGSSMLFVQTAAPTGWTKSTAHNDKALRVVSGTASSGGSVGFTTAFASQAVAGSIGSTTATNQATTATNVATTATNQATTQGGTVSTSVSGSVSGSVGNTTLSSGEMPSHSHNLSRGGNAVSVPSGSFYAPMDQSGSWSSDATGGSGSHGHSWSGSWSGSASSSFSGSSHNHTQDSHNHTQNSHNHTQDAHNHSFTGTAINLAVSYVDVIVATKD